MTDDGVTYLSDRASTAGASVVLKHVNKHYAASGGVTALDDVTLSIGAGSLVAATGASGSGKSTLLHVVGAMDVPDGGTIEVAQTEITTLSRAQQVAYRRRIGFVFQRFHLLPALSALDNVVAPLLPYKVDFDKYARGRDLLAAVGLEGREDSLPSQLSGGQQQRVAIARALVNEPMLLLADEPTGNLDSQTGAEIIDLVIALRQERGMTVILATHDQLIASRCDRVIRLRDGRVLDEADIEVSGSPDAILERITRIDM
jgi:putative ABC transport system ATP-binding protein